MGNVPTKVEQSGSADSSPGSYGGGQVRNRSRHASLVNSIFTGNSGSGGLMNGRPRATSMFDRSHHDKGMPKKKSLKEREAIKEAHAKNLVVKYDESVDGGYLAPFGCYGFDKLDYNADTVKKLIIDRKMAPFYTPLQDFDETWSKDELIKIIDGLQLHSSFNENLEEFEDVPIGNLSKNNFDYLIDKSLTKREQRRLHSKIFKARLYKKRIIWQETANETYLEQVLEDRKNNSNNSDTTTTTTTTATIRNKYLASKDLKYDLYSNGIECPICFLYLPGPFNYSKCCQQPICTECFVQIKRAEPHFPHEEVDPTQPITDDSEKDPNLLTSESSHCPYCATPDFHITYKPPQSRKTGIGGMPPCAFRLKSTENTNDIITNEDAKRTNRSEKASLNSNDNDARLKPAERINIVSSDDIRPDWEQKLNKERARLDRRAANANAIHASNQLIEPGYSSSTRRSSSEIPSTPATNATVNSTHSRTTSNTRNKSSTSRNNIKRQPTIEELENQMLQDAIRLSLQDHDTAKTKK